MNNKSNKSLLVGSCSDVGQIREHNEDSLLVKTPLFVVADGMGGHAAGEVASSLAVNTFEAADISSLDADALKRVVAEANITILEGSRDGLGRRGMGTTLTAAIIDEDRMLIAQIGDSRAYMMQDSVLRQVTRDHSLVEELMASGRITEQEAAVHPNRSVITRALGLDGYVQPDIYELRIHKSDRVLLCSDGLNTMLDDDTIESIMLQNPDPQLAADALVEAANDVGGFDNITVIVINVQAIDARSAAKQKRRLIRNTIGFALAFALLVGAAIGYIYLHARSSAFLIDEGGRVAMYRGLPGNILGIELNWLEKTTEIPVSSLSVTTAEELSGGIRTESLGETESLLLEYQKQQRK